MERLAVFPATRDALRNGYFLATFSRCSSKEVKVNGEKWNRHCCWTVECCPIRSRNASCKLVVTTCPRDTLFTSQCVSPLPVSRARFRKEIKCVWPKNASSTRSRHDGEKRGRVDISLTTRPRSFTIILFLTFPEHTVTKTNTDHGDKL